ncbi:hypothetical protein [Nonomuraea diastatica]|uniref:Helix-turn-helix domain-containing protein n=1 Tax=Nonomuraea diastatica TaxID=1848329 RepID=A0A4R4WQS0_9ACTN|nr:hypothetical protein [Nonomuraea diastatica]TDD17240.1 hypothetical protein E1294_28385 [Nonomuraea diastatica]
MILPSHPPLHKRGAVVTAASAGRPRQTQRGISQRAAHVGARPERHPHTACPAPTHPRTSRIAWQRVTTVSDGPDLLAGPSRALIAASVPRGMRRAGSQREWLRTLKEDAEVLDLRCDGYANLLRIANLIAWAADWATMCSRPTLARLIEVTGLATATVKRWVRWLRQHGWLGVVEQGSTCRFRKGTMAGLVDDGLGNRAAVWVLAVPRRSRAERLRDRNDQDRRRADLRTR